MEDDLNPKRDEVIILIAEDDDGHAELIRQHLLGVGLHNHIIRFKDGQEALNFLEGTGDGLKRDEGQAYILLLVIKMPVIGGIEVLKRVRANPDLKNLPVIMLTTTDDPQEIEQCYANGCNNYVTKPVDFYQFAETLKRLGRFIMVIKVAKI